MRTYHCALFILLAFCCAAAHAGEDELVALLLTDGMWARATSEGYVLYNVHGPQATLRRTREGYRLTGRDGRGVRIRRTRDGFVASPGAPRDSGLGEAFDAARRRRAHR